MENMFAIYGPAKKGCGFVNAVFIQHRGRPVLIKLGLYRDEVAFEQEFWNADTL